MQIEVGDLVWVTAPEHDYGATAPVFFDFTGTVIEINGDGTYEIEDGDGTIYDVVPEEFVELA